MLKRHSYNLWEDKYALNWAYHDKDLSSREVAELFGCSKSTILSWMEKLDIKRDPGPNKKGPWRDKTKLRVEYIDNEKSMTDLAEEWDTSTATIHRWLHRYNIEVLNNTPPKGEDHWAYGNKPNSRICDECGGEFTPKEKSQSYCSVECAHEKLKDRVGLKCETCGDEFMVRKARKDTAKYCSMECTKTREEIECKQCGDIFEVRPSRSHKKFCSRKCSQEYKTGKNHHNYKERIETECEWCGDTLVLIPWEYNQAERHFCDQECRSKWFTEWVSGRYTGEDHWMHGVDPEDHPMYNGGPFPYGPGWNTQKKQAVRERDGYECVICGMSQSEHYEKYDMNLHVHHIKQARNFDDPERRNDMDNLVTLCLACHRQYEGVPIDVVT